MSGPAPQRVYIAVGANIDPVRNIPRALGLLSKRARITGVSNFYITQPVGRPEQPEYRNGAVQIETAMSARALKFGLLRGIESELGRVRSEDKYAARELDLDILLYGDVAVEEADLHIPDPEIPERIFLALPLLDLCPALRLPDSGVPLADLQILRSGAPPVDAALTALLKERFTHE